MNKIIFMATKPFIYQEPFPMSKDQTSYYLLTKEHVSVASFEGKEILKVSKEGLTLLAETAFRDVEFLLRPDHQEQVAGILADPEASDNDKFVALTFLRNANIGERDSSFLSGYGHGDYHGEKGTAGMDRRER